MDRQSEAIHSDPSTPDPPAKKKRWWTRALLPPLLLGSVLGLLAAPLACTATVYPPADPSQPTAIFLLDHGRTPSLVLPVEGGGMVRYAYGDWNYYAMGKRGFLDSVLALFWPTQGTLGRLEMHGPVAAESIRDQLGVGIENLYEIRVPRAEVDRLREDLDELFRKNTDTLVYSASAEFYFVHHPERYTYFHNSNHVIADWLERLGAEVTGPTFYSTWETADPKEE